MIEVRVDDPCVKPLLPGYLARRREDVDGLLDALSRGDFAVIRVKGHNMYGSGAAYGLQAVSDIGASIEEAAKRRKPEQVMELVDALRDFLDEVKII